MSRKTTRAILRQLALAAALAVLAAAQVLPMPYKQKFPGDPARSEPEASALGYMRTVVYAQREYKKKKGHYAGSLYALVGSGSFTKRMTKTDRGDYDVSFGGGGGGFALKLTPKQFDSAHRAFYTDSSGVIRSEDEKPATADSPVLKEQHPESEPPKPSSNDSAPEPAQVPQGAATPADFLRQMAGAWEVSYFIVGGEGGSMGGVGATVAQPDPNTVTCALSRPGDRLGERVFENFTLFYNVTSKKYFLTVDSSFGLSFKKLSLSRRANQLSGEESVEIGGAPTKITVLIALTAEGGHDWNVRGLRAEVKEAKEGEERKTVEVQIGAYFLNFKKK